MTVNARGLVGAPRLQGVRRKNASANQGKERNNNIHDATHFVNDT